MIKYDMLFPKRINSVVKSMNEPTIDEKTMQQLSQSADEYIKDDSYYRPIETILADNTPDTTTIKLRIEQDNEKFDKHFVELSIRPKQSSLDVTRPLCYGNKSEIIEFLSKSESLSEITNNLTEMLNNIRRNKRN